MKKVFSSCVVMLAVGLALSASVHGQGSSKAPLFTVITVEKMDCAGCAQRISGKVKEVPGVDKTQFDVEKKLLWVHPKAGQQVSPRALWEAAEKANGQPTRLHGPSGVFTSKPKS